MSIMSTMSTKKFFTEYLLIELKEKFEKNNFPKYRAQQIWQWFYQKGICKYEGMGNIPAKLRESLSRELPLLSTKVIKVSKGTDTSEKRLIQLKDGETIETVWIPMGKHATVCVSTQVGCPVQCAFCASGADGLIRNLSAGEIVEQVWHIHAAHSRREINNLVFMGMGEPLLNYKNLLKAIQILKDEHGFCIGSRKITVSTTGVLKGINSLSEDAPQIKLAVSLHACSDNLRKKLIKNCPSKINELVNTLKKCYHGSRNRITFEYVLLKGINDSEADALKLAEIIRKIPSKVNLIPYNKVPNLNYESPLGNHVRKFEKVLKENNVTAVVRRKKGEDINAACGQLRRSR